MFGKRQKENEEENPWSWQDMDYPYKMKKLLDDEILTDCEFLVGPNDSSAKKIVGHKLMFILESPVFEKMMLGEFIEKNEPIRIIDASAHDFNNFRELIYYNNEKRYSDFNLQEIFALYHIAQKYLVSSILNTCITYLTRIAKSFEIEKLLTLFEFACQIENKIFQTSVENEISKFTSEIKLNTKINGFSPKIFYKYIYFISDATGSATSCEDAYENCNAKNLRTTNTSATSFEDAYYEHANRNSLGRAKQNSRLPPLTTPAQIFNAIHNYFKHNNLFRHETVVALQETSEEHVTRTEKVVLGVENEQNNEINKYESKKAIELEKKEEKLEISTFKNELLKLVNFNAMTAREFAAGPGTSNLLGTDEKYKLLAYLCLK